MSAFSRCSERLLLAGILALPFGLCGLGIGVNASMRRSSSSPVAVVTLGSVGLISLFFLLWFLIHRDPTPLMNVSVNSPERNVPNPRDNAEAPLLVEDDNFSL